jgi:hypothetical protein
MRPIQPFTAPRPLVSRPNGARHGARHAKGSSEARSGTQEFSCYSSPARLIDIRLEYAHDLRTLGRHASATMKILCPSFPRQIKPASRRQIRLPTANLDSRSPADRISVLPTGQNPPSRRLHLSGAYPSWGLLGKGYARLTPEVHADVAGVAKGKGLGSRQTFLEGARGAGGTKTRRAGPCLREGLRPAAPLRFRSF